MNYLFVVNTESQVHTWKHIIKQIKNNNGNVLIRARNHGHTLTLLRYEGLNYESFSSIRWRLFKPLDIAKQLIYGIKIKFSLKLKVVIGFGIDAAVIAKVCDTASVVFTDTEPIGVQNTLLRWFCTIIMTPSCFKNNLGNKQIKVPSYKELAYLHPDLFTPDSSLLMQLGIQDKTKYIIMRFNAFNAVHDINKKGFSLEEKVHLIHELAPLTRIFISSEIPLSDAIKQYELTAEVDRIHHILFHAALLITDAGTMATEAAVLGTPALLYLPDYHKFGNFNELEGRYGLVHCFDDSEQLLFKALELINFDNLLLDYSTNRSILLKEKVNMNQIFSKLIVNRDYFNEL